MDLSFHVITLFTGYLHYLHYSYEKYRNIIIEDFQILNKEHRIPYQVAIDSKFYLDFVLQEEPDFAYHHAPVTEENITMTLDWLGDKIIEIEEMKYPVNRFEVLTNFLRTQDHEDSVNIKPLDEVKNFIHLRLQDRPALYQPCL